MPEQGDPAQELASAAQGGQGQAAALGAASQETVSRAEFEALTKSVNQLVEGLKPIAGLEERLKQSQRDTIDDRVRKAVPADVAALGALAETLKPHLKEGTDLRQIQRNAMLDSLIAGASFPGSAAGSPQAPAQQPAQAASDPVTTEIGRILKDHGLTGREPELREFLTQNADRSLLVKLQGLEELAGTIASRQAGDAGTILGGISGRRSSPDLVKQYVDTMLTNKGKGLHVANQIKRQFAAQGVKVDEIDLLRPETWK